VIAAVAVGWIVLHGEKQSTPVTRRTQRVALSDAQQMKLGASEYRKELKKDRAQAVDSGPAYRRVQRVAARITAGAARDKPNFRWQATLIRSKQVNAYCGGKIVVYTSLLPVAKTDAGLATVLGHESRTRPPNTARSASSSSARVHGPGRLQAHRCARLLAAHEGGSKGKGQTPALLRDHPDDGTRIKQIRGWLPEAWRNYNPPT